MDGIDRVSAIPGVKIEVYPLIDAPHAHERQHGRPQSQPHHPPHEALHGDESAEEDDNGAYDDHGHRVHEHVEDIPPDAPHIDIVV
jgi:hypothetical protein